jgi:hypothetical protein
MMASGDATSAGCGGTSGGGGALSVCAAAAAASNTNMRFTKAVRFNIVTVLGANKPAG